MDHIIVGIIIVAAGYYCLKRFMATLKPDSGGCGGGCSCSAKPNGCPGSSGCSVRAEADMGETVETRTPDPSSRT